jgi:hypothetical protein
LDKTAETKKKNRKKKKTEDKHLIGQDSGDKKQKQKQYFWSVSLFVFFVFLLHQTKTLERTNQEHLFGLEPFRCT